MPRDAAAQADERTVEPAGTNGRKRAIADGLMARVRALQDNILVAFRGNAEVVRLSVACLLAEGHLLLEDVPGVGKTTLARAIAKSIDLPLRRIQFTSDLLPTDIVGVSIYEEQSQGFVFHRGPIFHNIVLADEINRASPRTQSALLEAMHERSVSVDNDTHQLPRPFLVIATQNPHEYHGTYPLPESQLDRFLLRLGLGYPTPETERALLQERGREEPVEHLQPVVAVDELERLMAMVDEVHVEDALIDYLMAVARATRESPRMEVGASTRACLTTLRAARAHALTMGRTFALPDDLDAVLVAALAHRVRLAGGPTLGARRQDAERALRDIIERVPAPR